MKRKCFIIGVLGAILVMTFTGCATVKVEYSRRDRNLSSNEHALLYIHRDTFIMAFNGVRGVMGSGRGLPWVYTIPPGTHRFLVDYGFPNQSIRNLEGSFDFQSGRFYYMRVEPTGRNTGNIVITDETDTTDPNLQSIQQYARNKLR